jgi:hypothetical protein
LRLIEAGIESGAFARLDTQLAARLIFAMLHEAESGEDRVRVLRSTRVLLDRCLRADPS